MSVHGFGKRFVSASALILGGIAVELGQPATVSAQEPAPVISKPLTLPMLRFASDDTLDTISQTNQSVDLWGLRSFRGEFAPRGQEPEANGQPGEPISMGSSFSNCAGGNCGCSAHGHYPTIGNKRVPNALFEMDSANPASVIRLRFDSAYDHEFPDRAEFFWAKTVNGRGPELAERSVDYQDFNFYMETALGIGGASTFTEIPIRVLDPSVNDNTAGLSDIVVGLKTVLMDHDDFQISMIMRTYIPSGLARR